jgi:dTDP-4-amino-4,6-dideoxygalactose transaminase
MEEAQHRGQIAGNGHFTGLCRALMQQQFGFVHSFFTPSCTSALEMAALACDFKPGEEVILPGFTHVGTANAFVRAGAVLRFGDCVPGEPYLDPASVRSLIGPKTRAIVVVHYAGIACDMDEFRRIARDHRLLLIEDAAHALGARHGHQWVGSLGDLAAFSFHETKNVTCGQGGMLVVNRRSLVEKLTQIWHHGTNRSDFNAGKIPFYTWIRPGGPYLMPELNAAFLYAQLCELEQINSGRMAIWERYNRSLASLEASGLFKLPVIPPYARHNAHIFYLVAATTALRNDLLDRLNQEGIQATFHYVPLHTSPYVRRLGNPSFLPHTEHIADHLLRLPLYNSLSVEKTGMICDCISEWAGKHSVSTSRYE